MLPRIYLTTTLPYVNADPHLGFAFEVVTADIVARYRRLFGHEVFFNTGTDEHGVKVYRAAAGRDLQAYVDDYAGRFQKLKATLNLTHDHFSRTTDPRHTNAAQEFWRRCAAAGDIYRKNYPVKYCVGCELEKTDSELDAGRCPIHPMLTPELIEEENYFFRFSKYQKPLLELYRSRPDFVVPATRLHEIRSFVERGLEDFSISRLASKMPWGIPVPDDPSQTMYVWFDALVNYISAIGWPNDLEKFEKWWPVIQFAGKDNLRQQAAMWQAMLLSASSVSRDGSAGLPPSKQIVIHGFVISGGQKMSKSLGNVIDPTTLVEAYGTDAVRYFLARHIEPFEDTDVTLQRFKEIYNANLANGLGNLVSRVMKMASDHLPRPAAVKKRAITDFPDLLEPLARYELNRALDLIWRHVGLHDAYIQETKPFNLIKTEPDKAREIITKLVQGLADLAVVLEPFLPQTAAAITDLIRENKPPAKPLFPRK
ncbi:MAG: methionine--tRNA ligase [Patescibacteria group bacterium]